MKWHSNRAVIGGLMMAAICVTSSAVSAQTKELVLSGFGGGYDEAMAASVKSFEQENGVKVTIVAGSGANNIARVRNKEVDVIVSDCQSASNLDPGSASNFDPLVSC